jgi:hypothetical protein
MAVNYTPQKLDTVERLKNITTQFSNLLAEALQLRQEALDNAFQPGGANGITDAELNGGTEPPYPNLATTDITAIFAAYIAIDTTLAASSRTHYKAFSRIK